MIFNPWWQRWPDRLQRELDELAADGVVYVRDEAAFARGIARYSLQADVSGRGMIRLIVTFPDLYPYFPFQLSAPDLSLGYHQDPFQKNLCLLGRATDRWYSNFTAAALIRDQLPKVLEAAEAQDRQVVADREQNQAEPFTDYYDYPPAIVLVQSDWVIDPNVHTGSFSVGTMAPDRSQLGNLLRGAMLELRDSDGRILAKADAAIRNAFSGVEFNGSWVRVAKELRFNDPSQFVGHLVRHHPQIRFAKPQHVNDGWLQVFGVLFPEQVGWRQLGWGWVFACCLGTHRHDMLDNQPESRAAKPPARKARRRK